MVLRLKIRIPPLAYTPSRKRTNTCENDELVGFINIQSVHVGQQPTIHVRKNQAIGVNTSPSLLNRDE